MAYQVNLQILNQFFSSKIKESVEIQDDLEYLMATLKEYR